jgi:hypothetical protein
MPEIKTTDGFFFLGPVLMLISLLIMSDNLSGFTPELWAFLFSIRINLVAAVVFAFGMGFLAVAFAARFKLAANSSVFMFFEGTGLVTAVVGFFVYGFAMKEQISSGPYYTLIVSLSQFFIGLIVWAIGIFLIIFAGACTEKKEERVIFFIVLVTLSVCAIALSVLFPLDVAAI